MEYILKLRKMKILKTTIKCIFYCFLLIYSTGGDVRSETSLVIETNDLQGYWKQGVVGSRKVVFTDKADNFSEIRASVPKDGKYNLLVYLHHDWRNREAFPGIYVEAVDSKGIQHKGYHLVENIWYLDEEAQGRWFFVSLSKNPYWVLPQGELYLKFWAVGKTFPWEGQSIPLEGKVSINSFFLMPVFNSDSGMFSLGIINPESGKGDWEVHNYHPLHATNFIKTDKKNAQFLCETDIVKAGYYQAFLSVFSPSGGNLELNLKGQSDNRATVIRLDSSKEWLLIPTETMYLDKGYYSLMFKNLTSKEVMIDFVFLAPSEKSFK